MPKHVPLCWICTEPLSRTATGNDTGALWILDVVKGAAHWRCWTGYRKAPGTEAE